MEAPNCNVANCLHDLPGRRRRQQLHVLCLLHHVRLMSNGGRKEGGKETYKTGWVSVEKAAKMRMNCLDFWAVSKSWQIRFKWMISPADSMDPGTPCHEKWREEQWRHNELIVPIEERATHLRQSETVEEALPHKAGPKPLLGAPLQCGSQSHNPPSQTNPLKTRLWKKTTCDLHRRRGIACVSRVEIE